MTSNLNESAVGPIKPLMLAPGVAIGLFTHLLKDQGYGVDMFETTHYDTDETNYSETKINYSENRVRLLNVRKFDVKKDLNIELKQDMAKTYFGEDADNAAADLREDYRVNPKRMTTVALDQLMSPMVGH